MKGWDLGLGRAGSRDGVERLDWKQSMEVPGAHVILSICNSSAFFRRFPID